MSNAKLTGVLAGCVLLLGATCAQAQDWPQWRGTNRDNKVAGFTAPKEWPKELTKKWSVKVGDGDASPVLVGDKLYVFTREGGDEVLRCLDAAKGEEKWKEKYPAQAVSGAASRHPGPRSTPAVADGKICTFGVGGYLCCRDAATGKELWKKDTKAWPGFFTSASPVIVDGKCVVFLGKMGAGALTAFDLASGEEKWKWTDEAPSYGSPVLMTVDGTKMLITLAQKSRMEGSLVGVNVADGKVLWKVPFNASYNSGTPVIDGQRVICSGPNQGTVAYKIEKKDDGFNAKEVWKQAKSPAGIYNTPVLKDGLLFGLSSTSPREAPTNFYCLDAKSGEPLWADDTRRGACGTVLDAGTVLIALSSNGDLIVFKPSKEKFEEVAKYKVGDAPWTYPVIAGNRVFVKDKDSVILWTID
jgi:outer membrane protein assembly factor BamB